jgi:putative transposase
MIKPEPQAPTISEQCELLSLPRSAYYYQAAAETPLNQALMRRIDELHTANPTWGSRLLRDRLRLEGYRVNRKRIQRLMAVMQLQVLYPKRNLSRRNHQHKVYPYLLKGLKIQQPNQVWSTDITYIRLRHGWAYLVAVLDWYSRAVLSFRLSNTCDRFFCIEALEEALQRYGKPEIFNTDQGATFTSPDFTGVLQTAGVKISMDGAGRALDNVVTERFWRTLKYDEVYLKDYESLTDARYQIGVFIEQYNTIRPHSACAGLPPMLRYTSRCEDKIPA